MSGSVRKRFNQLPTIDKPTLNSSTPQIKVSINKERPLSIRLLWKAELSLAVGAFFGMLAVICIVFLPMSALVSPVVVLSTFVAALSAITALVLLIMSSSAVAIKEDMIIEQEPLSISPLVVEANYMEEEVA
ncbi:hypothetical protein ACQUW5_07930 [Legionella sp. CNM-1927-20]|uniref:hypothetical protein n=1 Tax=Legionella sp. CNM-1927-20 TaxID=3422221 RepID=UPI00403B2698